MSFSPLFIFNPALLPLLPPGLLLNHEVAVQAATAEEMTAGVKKALQDVEAINAVIVANPEIAEFKLWIADVTFSGGGDGHTFITTLFFSPAPLNALAQFLAASGTGLDLSPEFFGFEFALASTAEALVPLYGPLFQALVDAGKIAQNDPDVELVLGLFDLNAGAAKGTRFMVGIGAIINPVEPPPQVAIDTTSTTVPIHRNILSALPGLSKLSALKATRVQPNVAGASPATALGNFLNHR